MHPLQLLLACTLPAYIPSEPPPPDTAADTSVPCSALDPTAASFTLSNASQAPLRLYWRDGNCAETLYAELPPGGTHTQNTYLRAVWVLRDTGDELLDWFEVTEVGPLDVKYP